MLRRLIFSFAFGFAAMALVASPAIAQQYPDTPPVDVEDDDVTRVTTPPVDVEDDDVTRVPPRGVAGPDAEVAGDVVTRGLPVTGGDLLGLAAMGAAAVAIGGVLVVRRRSTT